MDSIYQELKHHLFNEDKEQSVSYVHNILQTKQMDIIEFYSNVLTPLLNNMDCELEDKRICIWREHVITAIARTIVENCYPYVLAKRDELGITNKGIATVLCPPDEYHDLGARMVADFFTVRGYRTIFVGSNTPYQDFYQAIPIIQPAIIAISVGDYYNLVAAKKMIEEMRKAVNDRLTIVVGGNAFHDDSEHKAKSIGADFYAKTYEDIVRITEGKVIG